MSEPLAAMEILPFHHAEASHRGHLRSIMHIADRRAVCEDQVPDFRARACLPNRPRYYIVRGDNEPRILYCIA